MPLRRGRSIQSTIREKERKEYLVDLFLLFLRSTLASMASSTPICKHSPAQPSPAQPTLRAIPRAIPRADGQPHGQSHGQSRGQTYRHSDGQRHGQSHGQFCRQSVGAAFARGARVFLKKIGASRPFALALRAAMRCNVTSLHRSTRKRAPKPHARAALRQNVSRGVGVTTHIK